MRRIFLCFAAFVTMINPSAGITPVHAGSVPTSGLDTDALDTYVTGQMSRQGISAAVLSGDEIIYLEGDGTAGKDRPMTPQTPMYVGSQSKSFTGRAIAQLIEQGKLKLGDPVPYPFLGQSPG